MKSINLLWENVDMLMEKNNGTKWKYFLDQDNWYRSPVLEHEEKEGFAIENKYYKIEVIKWLNPAAAKKTYSIIVQKQPSYECAAGRQVRAELNIRDNDDSQVKELYDKLMALREKLNKIKEAKEDEKTHGEEKNFLSDVISKLY
jgi:hypothetical protein